MIKIDQISKGFDNDVVPVKNLSEEIRKGDVISLMVPPVRRNRLF